MFLNQELHTLDNTRESSEDNHITFVFNFWINNALVFHAYNLQLKTHIKIARYTRCKIKM